jgi:hypothetical protein
MKLPRSGPGQLSLEVIELADHERPPMIGIPEYLEKRRVDGGLATTIEPESQPGQAALSEQGAADGTVATAGAAAIDGSPERAS